jgi:hypothetical protein
VKTLHEAKRNKNSLNHLQAETRHDDTLLLRYLAAQMDAGAVADATRTALFLAQKTLPADVQSDDTFTKEIIATMESKRKGSSEPIQRLIKTHLDKQQDDARREQQPEISAFVRESLSRARAETDSSKRASEILAIISVPGWTAALKPDEQQNLWDECLTLSRSNPDTQSRIDFLLQFGRLAIPHKKRDIAEKILAEVTLLTSVAKDADDPKQWSVLNGLLSLREALGEDVASERGKIEEKITAWASKAERDRIAKAIEAQDLSELLATTGGSGVDPLP